jgi:hypothetical protein
MKKTLFYFVISFGMLYGCKSKDVAIPNDVLNPEEFSLFLADCRLAEANQILDYQRGLREKKYLDTAYSHIYLLHNTDTAEIRRTFDFYNGHPKIFSEVSEKSLVILNKKKLENLEEH